MTQAFHFPDGVLVCPVCSADLVSFNCASCKNEYFSLSKIPCIFPAGIQQKALWQHQMAMMGEQGAKALARLDHILQGYDVAELTRDRLEVSYAAMEESLATIMALLTEGGLEPQFDERFGQATVDNPTEYYHHILRDWAWDDEPSEHFETHANDANLDRVLKVWPDAKAQKMLVLGAGAGRLSWDLHEKLSPEFTIASDINPFLLACAEGLVKGEKAIVLPELYTYPQIGFPYSKSWEMSPVNDPNGLSERWFALGADVWNMPLRESSVDTIVTSWLLDVTGGDVKDLISVIAYLLKPNGRWINTGPLLYSQNLSFDKKYSADEILHFAALAGFNVEHQQVEEIAHMASPMNARYHHEQVWSFNALKVDAQYQVPEPSRSPEWLLPPWMILHHLPIPLIDFKCQVGHEFIREVLSLVDGRRSIYLIGQMLQSSVPEGVNARDAVATLFGQILEQMAEG